MGRAGFVVVLLLGAALTVGLQACGETLVDTPWTARVDTATLYSLANPNLALSSAYDFFDRTRVHVEQAGMQRAWDLALDTRGGTLVLVPPGALGIDSKARVAALPGQSFAQVQEAPADTLVYSSKTPVPLDLNTTYVVHTDLRSSPFGLTCQYYAKMQPISIDPAAGTMRFISDTSPICNDRRLVPPDSTK
jgi:hypothetical protein